MFWSFINQEKIDKNKGKEYLEKFEWKFKEIEPLFK